MKIFFNQNKEVANKELEKNVESDSKLKELIVNYVGEHSNPDDDNVTTEMIVDVYANEFPEFLMAVAEENFIRGYQQGIDDSHSFNIDEPECGNPFVDKRPGSE